MRAKLLLVVVMCLYQCRQCWSSAAYSFTNVDISITSHSDSSVEYGGDINLTTILTGTVQGNYSTIGMCWFQMFSDGGIERAGLQECGIPIVDPSGNFAVEFFPNLRYYALTFKFLVVIIDSETLHHIAEKFVIIDILNSYDDNFLAPSQELVQSYQQERREKDFEVDQSSALSEVSSISIFLRDLDLHGTSSRLVNFGCSACALHDVGRMRAKVQFIIGAQKGVILETLQSCKCDIVFLPSLAMSIHTSSLSNDILSDVVDWKLIDMLNATDVIIIPNTLGDIQTNTVMHHVKVFRQLGSFLHATHGADLGSGDYVVDSYHLKDVYVALDLCNIFNVELNKDILEEWNRIIDGFVAPSVYMQKTNFTEGLPKDVTVVYPSMLLTKSDGSPLFPHDGVKPWPRLLSGRFRVGMFGRCSIERSPGLFIRAVTIIARLRSETYIRDSFDFVVVGGGSFVQSVNELATRLGVSHFITFLDNSLSNSEMIDWLCNSDLIVNPTFRGETFGIMHAEAMVCGTPVVTFNRSASQESLHAGASYLVQGGVNVTLQLAEAILDAYEKPQQKYNWTTDSLTSASEATKDLMNPIRGAFQFVSALEEMNTRKRMRDAP